MIIILLCIHSRDTKVGEQLCLFGEHKGGVWSFLSFVMSASNVFYIECAHATEDNFFQLQEFVEYLNSHMKVDKLRNNLANKVSVEADTAGKKIKVEASVKYSKRACRYYTRKFLQKKDIRDRFKVVASSKNSYEHKPYRPTNE